MRRQLRDHARTGRAQQARSIPSPPPAGPTRPRVSGSGRPTAYGAQTAVHVPRGHASGGCTPTTNRSGRRLQAVHRGRPPLRPRRTGRCTRAQRQLRHARTRAGPPALSGALVARRQAHAGRATAARGSRPAGAGCRCEAAALARPRRWPCWPPRCSAPPPAARRRRPIRHVFVIVLENESASTTFGPNSPAPYLSQTLRAAGRLPAQLLRRRPREQRQLHRDDQRPGAQRPEPGRLPGLRRLRARARSAPTARPQGTGCVYPAAVPTIASQLTAAGFTWRDYNEDMGADPTRETIGLRPSRAQRLRQHPEGRRAADQYATRHNPFVYFHSIIDDTDAVRHARGQPRPAAAGPGLARGARPTTSSSPPTCATTATTRRAPTASPAAWPRPTSSCRPGCPRSPARPRSARTGC